jgi:glutamate synthase (NADPH) large chain
VVVLGPVGWNLAAGMSGGELFVLGTPANVTLALNGDLASIAKVTTEAANRLQALVQAHHKATGSPLARRLLADWGDSVVRFVRIVPTPVAQAEKSVEPIEAVPA